MKPTLEGVVQPGMVVSGYRIEKKLGAGASGTPAPGACPHTYAGPHVQREGPAQQPSRV